ncbi:MAG: hypothetical protein UZ21_OP11001001151 [Microgenomates bacterium OLB22]|nr:MAG: hypothetical protein UZ21_OP11001001151 [Microgenomates bacterium OLB22]
MGRINLLQSQDKITSRRRQDTQLRLVAVGVGGLVLVVGAVLLGLTFFQQQTYNALLQKKATLIRRTAEGAEAQKKIGSYRCCTPIHPKGTARQP